MKVLNKIRFWKFGNLWFVLCDVVLKGLVVLLLELVHFQRMDHLGQKERLWLGINSAGTLVPNYLHEPIFVYTYVLFSINGVVLLLA